MATSRSFHDPILANPCESATPFTSENDLGRSNVERSHPADEDIAGLSSHGPSDERNLGILGQSPAADHKPLHPKIAARCDFRPGELCQLLNSTPLGEVINERQLYRHRASAGFGKRVNLFRYVAWLVEKRHVKTTAFEKVGQRIREHARKKLAGCSISAADVLRLLECQKYRCALTGRPLTPDTVALDHIIPVSRDGTHSIDNAQALHKDVNRAKGTLTNQEFIQLCQEVARFTSRRKGV